MGRLKKYNTEEEKRQANKEACKKYYWKNKEAMDSKARNRYQKKNGNCLSTPKNRH